MATLHDPSTCMTHAPRRTEWDEGLSQLTPLPPHTTVPTPHLPPVSVSEKETAVLGLPDELATLKLLCEDLRKEYQKQTDKIANVITRLSKLEVGQNESCKKFKAHHEQISLMQQQRQWNFDSSNQLNQFQTPKNPMRIIRNKPDAPVTTHNRFKALSSIGSED